MRYKKGLANNHGDALSSLETLGETEIEIDDEIPCMFGEVLCTTKQPDCCREEYSPPLDLVSAKTTDTDPSEQLERISSEEIVLEQHSDPFCQAIRSRLNGGKYWNSKSTSEGS